jgi:hypothetical protein
MADGVRIQPQPARLAAEGIGSVANRLFIVRDQSRPMPPNPHRPACRLCGHPHQCKTYHLQLDGEGTIIVSTTIWAHMRKLFDHGGFEAVNVVSEPPTQGLILPSAVARVIPAKM